MILNSVQIKAHQKEVGVKTLNLLKLSELGLKVPPFLAIGMTAVSKLFQNQKFREDISAEIQSQLKVEKYAVRSSALIEDSASSSMAGQFHTEINVAPEELPEAIIQVLLQAQEKKALQQFSLIIQEFIEPDWAGVTFTRNPLEGREMIIESYRGRGEELVSGKVEPQRFTFYFLQDLPDSFPLTTDQIEQFRQIEIAFDFPQDIEWCLRDGELYLLQSRPITTIVPKKFKEIKILEALLSKKESYFFEKTEISEIAPKPKPFLMSLLQKIYSQGGPVSQVYKEKSIYYQDTNFLKLVGSELYVDKEKELQSLLPSYSILKDYRPHFSRFKGLFKTFKNILSLAKLRGDRSKLFLTLKAQLSSKSFISDFKLQSEDFFKIYKIVFEINLLAGTAIKKLEEILKREKLSVLEALSFSKALFIETEGLGNIDFIGDDLRGNSLNIEDQTPFSKAFSSPILPHMNLWEALPNWKKTYLKPFISDALFWQQMREMGRWLTVKKINELKKSLHILAKKQAFDDPNLIYFLKLEEWLSLKIDLRKAKKRKEEYEAYYDFTFPQKLTDHFQLADLVLTGLSPGVAVGRLVELHDIQKINGKKILYTEVLSPELTQYFDEIEGILSKTGGLLSHLAIIAREKGLPVITNFQLPSINLNMGDKIEINGSTGKVRPLK